MPKARHTDLIVSRHKLRAAKAGTQSVVTVRIWPRSEKKAATSAANKGQNKYDAILTGYAQQMSDNVEA